MSRFLSAPPPSVSLSPQRRSGTVRAGASCHAPPFVSERLRPAGSLYEVLRVEHTASPTEIKTAYRSLAKVYHPDAAESDDGREFIEIHNAYATLSDPSARALYDLSMGGGCGFDFGRRQPVNRSGFYPTRRWETDQCW